MVPFALWASLSLITIRAVGLLSEGSPNIGTVFSDLTCPVSVLRSGRSMARRDANAARVIFVELNARCQTVVCGLPTDVA